MNAPSSNLPDGRPSPQLKQANDWTREMFAKYGAMDAHLEGWTMDRSWARGTASARMVSPAEHPLTIAAAGWSPSPPGAAPGGGGVFAGEGEKEFAQISGGAKGGRGIYSEPGSRAARMPGRPTPFR